MKPMGIHLGTPREEGHDVPSSVAELNHTHTECRRTVWLQEEHDNGSGRLTDEDTRPVRRN